MDKTSCRRIITSEEYIDFIVRYGQKKDIDIYQDMCYQRVDDNWLIVYERLSDIPALSYGNYGYFPIPKLYGLMDTSSMVSTGVVKTLYQNNLALDGKNIIIGFVDTGIDYLHEAFVDSYGHTRILSIWDQTINTGVAPRGIDYGSEYVRADIDAAMNLEDPYSIVPSVDTNGHGTFIAGVAAGSNYVNEFLGAASGCDIAMVKLREAKKALKDYYLIDTPMAYSESDIMMGISYLLEVAAKHNKPLVICLGLGTSYGPHTYGTPLGIMLERVAQLPRCVVVLPVGNEAVARHHYRGYVSTRDEYITASLVIEEGERGFIAELWARPGDNFSVEIITPTGELIERVRAYSQFARTSQFVFDKTTIDITYRLVETLSGNQLIAMRFISPTKGLWQIRVYADNVLDGNFDIWLPIEGFIKKDTYFVESNPDITITQPSSATYPISVGAFNHKDGSMWLQSGRGYTADRVIKPELVAPGAMVYGPVAGRDKNGYGYRSGTSIACAHVAGCAAMLLEYRVKREEYSILNTQDIKNLLILGAYRKPGNIYPNPLEGYGYLDIYRVFEKLSGIE